MGEKILSYALNASSIRKQASTPQNVKSGEQVNTKHLFLIWGSLFKHCVVIFKTNTYRNLILAGPLINNPKASDRNNGDG